jgi:hypothetical protein
VLRKGLSAISHNQVNLLPEKFAIVMVTRVFFDHCVT